MNWRNAAYNVDGDIDCEVEHQSFGWVPFTARENAPNANEAEVYEAAKDTATPYQSPPPDPEGDLAREREGMVVSAFQAKAALSNASLYTAAETAVTLQGGITLLAWQTAIEYRRNSPTVLALQVTLNLTDVQVDDLFRAAALIDA